MNKLLTNVGVFLLLISSMISVGQETTDFDVYKKKYPDDDAVVLSSKNTMEIVLKDGKLTLLNKRFSEKMFLNDDIKSYDDYISYDEYDKNVEVDAYLLSPDGTSYKKQQVKTIIDENDTDGSSFYDGSMYKKVIYPAISKGCRTVFSYQQEIIEPRFMPQFYFASGMPTVLSEYTVKVPKEVTIKYDLINVDTTKVIFEKKEGRKFDTYTWKMSDIKEYKHTGSVAYSYYAPFVFVRICDYTVNGTKIKILSDVAELHNWYYSHIKDLNAKFSEPLVAMVDSLVKGKTSDTEKARSIFYWVQNNIKYIAYEQGKQGFVPEEGNVVFQKRHGDCKGMSSLLYAMLKIAKVPAYYTWVGTRSLPYTYEKFPSPIADNHMIVTVVLDGEKVFLDATGSFIKLGWPTSMTLGKEALVSKDEKNFEIVKITDVPYEKNTSLDSVELWIDGDNLKGKSVFKAIGYNKNDISIRLLNMDEKTLKEEIVDLLQIGNNKFKLDTFKIQNLDDRDKELIINYEFTIPEYLKKYKDAVYVNLNVSKNYADSKIDTAQYIYDNLVSFKNVENLYVKLNIPQGYVVSNVPANYNQSSDKYGFSFTYEKGDKYISMRKRFYLNDIWIRKADYDSWNNMIDKLSKMYGQNVTLKKL